MFCAVFYRKRQCSQQLEAAKLQIISCGQAINKLNFVAQILIKPLFQRINSTKLMLFSFKAQGIQDSKVPCPGLVMEFYLELLLL